MIGCPSVMLLNHSDSYKRAICLGAAVVLSNGCKKIPAVVELDIGAMVHAHFHTPRVDKVKHQAIGARITIYYN